MAKARGLWLCCLGARSLGGKKGFHAFTGFACPRPAVSPGPEGESPEEGPPVPL
jgi:hypothetical protein